MIFTFLFDFFFPRQCIICAELLKNGNKNNKALCSSCLQIFPSAYSPAASGNYCNICSRRLVSEKDICSICRGRKYLFKYNISLWDYRNKFVRKAIHEYKFNGKKHASWFFAESIYRIYYDHYLNIPVVPAPCSQKRIEKYGWDHMRHICKILSRNYGISAFFLFKKGKTHQQKELDYEKRQTELRGRISIQRKNAAACLKCSETVILLDDVFTTGATAGYCSELLINYGFKNIIILTIALD